MEVLLHEGWCWQHGYYCCPIVSLLIGLASRNMVGAKCLTRARALKGGFRCSRRGFICSNHMQQYARNKPDGPLLHPITTRDFTLASAALVALV
jgi:hypothetical protein